MSKNLVLTICIGKRYGKLGEQTLPTIKSYAEKINADYQCISEQGVDDISPHFAKFQISKLLDVYDRIVYIDADCIVRDDTPDLFSMVPETHFGAYDEGQSTQGRPEAMLEAARSYNINIPQHVLANYKGQYYNTGVLVISKCHKPLFESPKEQFLIDFWEQSLINARLIASEMPVEDLSFRFNRMTCMDVTGEDRHASYIVHYAGCPLPETMFIATIKRDLDIWKQHAPNYKFARHVLISVTGGLGDQVASEPVVRRAIEKEYKGCDIHIVSHFPRIFAHLKECNNVSVYSQGTMLNREFPYMQLATVADDRTYFAQHTYHGMMHQVDYSSIYMLRKQIPHIEKTIKLKVGLEDVAELVDSVGIHEFDQFVVVHPGRGWDSKTFPASFWNDILIGLKERGRKVAVIGRYLSKEHGTVDGLIVPDGVCDWRNKLSLSALMVLLSQASTLISNDSAPVHIAGAFDNEIILIPSCKHPDQILPYRHGSQSYKAVSLYKKLIVNEFLETDLNADSNFTSACVKDGIDYSEYLPEPIDVVAACCESKDAT